MRQKLQEVKVLRWVDVISYNAVISACDACNNICKMCQIKKAVFGEGAEETPLKTWVNRSSWFQQMGAILLDAWTLSFLWWPSLGFFANKILMLSICSNFTGLWTRLDVDWVTLTGSFACLVQIQICGEIKWPFIFGGCWEQSMVWLGD